MNTRRIVALDRLERVINRYEADIDKDTGRFDKVTASDVMATARETVEDLQMSLGEDIEIVKAIKVIKDCGGIVTW